MENKLKEILEKGKDWSRMNTTVEGIFVLKLPAYRGKQARLAVELNPTDEFGRPTKKRGLLLRSIEELETFKKMLAQDKLFSLMENIEKICGKPDKKDKVEVILL